MKAGEVTPEMVDRMVELRRQGWTISAIARELHVSRPTAQAHLLQRDADLRDTLPGERGCLVTPPTWLQLPPVRLRLQLAAEGR